MPSLSPDRLLKLALDALEEVVAEAEHRPARRTWAVRFSLAYLSALDRGRWREGEPYRDFWRAMSMESATMRCRTLRSALTTIYAWADEERDPVRVAFFAEQARGSDG